MSLRRRVHGWLRRQRTAFWLRRCDVGPDPVLDGAPTIGASGRIVIGRGFRLSSEPVQSHLITGAGATLSIGDDVAIGHGAAIAVYSGITIGSGTQIGPYLIAMDTDFHTVGERAATFDGEPIAIGRDVRIGSHVTILQGSTIGDGAAVASGSVVSGRVAAGARVSGVPARVVVERPRGSATADDVPSVVMRALSLPGLPGPTDGPREYEQWDSLGALTILLALEDAFGVSLDDRRVATAGSVSELSALVEEARLAQLADHAGQR